MPDPTTLGLGAIVAYIGKDGIEKLLGPTADYLGEGLRDFTKKRVDNIAAIFANASRKLGAGIEQPGRVSPRVLKEILNEGSFSEDPVSIEYFGGVLASSRSEVGRDDRGARIAKLVDGLSAYQLRAHYLIYNSLYSLYHSSSASLATDESRAKARLFIPFEGFAVAMGFSQIELSKLEIILSHTMFGLHADDLITGRFQYSSSEAYLVDGEQKIGAGISCQPSSQGAELFLWAYGFGDRSINLFFSNDFAEKIDHDIVSLANAKKAP